MLAPGSSGGGLAGRVRHQADIDVVVCVVLQYGDFPLLASSAGAPRRAIVPGRAK